MARIFISYRRSDSRVYAGRIYDRLVQAFGKRDVFKDIDSIHAGANFPRVLRDATAQCQVMLVVIGPTWLNASDEKGHRRLDNLDDFVRQEVETGLGRKEIIVIPLLVDNARMPSIIELPDTIKELAYNNAVTIQDDPNFHRDMDRLINQMRSLLRGKPVTQSVNRKMLLGITVALLIMFAAVLALTSIFAPQNPENTTPAATTAIALIATDEPSATLTRTQRPTSTITVTPSITPTDVPTLEIAFIVQTLDVEATKDQATSNAQATFLARATEYAVGTENAINQTGTASVWTKTPTPNMTASIDAFRTQQAATATAIINLTQTATKQIQLNATNTAQVFINQTSTQQVQSNQTATALVYATQTAIGKLQQTATQQVNLTLTSIYNKTLTAEAWTDTPSPTLTFTSTYTPTQTLTSTPTFTYTPTKTRTPSPTFTRTPTKTRIPRPTSTPRQVTFNLASNPPISGPISATLTGEQDELVEVYNITSFPLRDGIYHVTFFNPSISSQQVWDFGILFRDNQGNDQFRLIINSDKRWVLENWTPPRESTVLKEGMLSTSLNVNAGGNNTIMLIVFGDTGIFLINDIFISVLDLSVRNNAGITRVGIELNIELEVAGSTTRFNASSWGLVQPFEPLSGVIQLKNNGYVEQIVAPEQAQNFVTQVIVDVPYDSTEGTWDFGFLLSDPLSSTDADFRFVFFYDKTWTFYYRDNNDTLQNQISGNAGNLKVGSGTNNEIIFVKIDNTGIILLNGEFLTTLNFSRLPNATSLSLASGIFTGNERDATNVTYRDFSLWKLTGCTVYIPSNVNIRSQPSSTSSIVRVSTGETRLVSSSSNSTWFRLDEENWVSKLAVYPSSGCNN